MPDDRFFHKRAGHSEKVNQLTDFEELAWRYYIESADDFGVMRFSAVTLQADHDRMAERQAKTVQKALERVRDVGLILSFEHQGRVYCCQHDWQEFQKVDYPRPTVHPAPPAAVLAQCTELTQALFGLHPGGKRLRKRTQNEPEDSGSGSGTLPENSRLTRARPLAEATATATATAEGGAGETTPTRRAGAFCQWYEDTHERLFRVGYIGTRNDYETTLRLVAKFTDEELRDAAMVWFGQDDDFATKGTRTIPKFASRASDCVLLARRVAS